MKLKETAMIVLKKVKSNSEKQIVTMEYFHTKLRAEGVVYPWIRKEALLYLEAIGEIKIDGQKIKLLNYKSYGSD